MSGDVGWAGGSRQNRKRSMKKKQGAKRKANEEKGGREKTLGRQIKEQTRMTPSDEERKVS